MHVFTTKDGEILIWNMLQTGLANLQRSKKYQQLADKLSEK